MGLQIRSPHPLIETAQFAHTAATTSKTPLLVGAKLVIPLDDADANTLNAFVTRADISGGAKTTAEAWAPMQSIYWDDTAKKFTTTVGSNTLVGYAKEAALAADTVTPLFHFRSA